MKNGGKNKSAAFIILVSVIINTYTDIFIKYLKISKYKHALYIMSVHPYCVRVDKFMIYYIASYLEQPEICFCRLANKYNIYDSFPVILLLN